MRAESVQRKSMWVRGCVGVYERFREGRPLSGALSTMRILTCVFIFIAVGFAPDSFAATRFVVMTDSRGPNMGVNDEVYSRILDSVLKLNPQPVCILFGGDLVTNGTEQEYEHWLEMTKPVFDAKIPLYASMGNHDFGPKRKGMETLNIETFKKVFDHHPDNGPQEYKKLTYSFDLNGIHFISLHYEGLGMTNPGYGMTNPAQQEWLEKDLAGNTNAHVFVFTHVPAYPTGHHVTKKPAEGDEKKLEKEAYEKYVKARDTLWATLDKFNIDAYFAGHEHNYSRWLIDNRMNKEWKNRIYQVVAGSCGAPLHSTKTEKPDVFIPTYNYVVVDVEGEGVAIKAYNDSNKLIDEMSFTRNPKKEKNMPSSEE